MHLCVLCHFGLKTGQFDGVAAVFLASALLASFITGCLVLVVDIVGSALVSCMHDFPLRYVTLFFVSRFLLHLSFERVATSQSSLNWP